WAVNSGLGGIYAEETRYQVLCGNDPPQQPARRLHMRLNAFVIAGLFLLFLVSPLPGLENPASPISKDSATENAVFLFTNQSIQAAPLQCTKPITVPETRMTARECAELCGCCVCWQFVTK